MRVFKLSDREILEQAAELIAPSPGGTRHLRTKDFAEKVQMTAASLHLRFRSPLMTTLVDEISRLFYADLASQADLALYLTPHASAEVQLRALLWSVTSCYRRNHWFGRALLREVERTNCDRLKVLKQFEIAIKKMREDGAVRPDTNPTLKSLMAFNLISDFIVAPQVQGGFPALSDQQIIDLALEVVTESKVEPL